MKNWISRSLIFALALLLLLAPVAHAAAQESTADLSLTKTVDDKTMKIGQNITFTITVTNLGPDTATNVVFGDPLPDPLNFVSSACDTGVVSWGFCTVSSLAVGESATVTVTSTPVTNPAKSERRFTNTAFIVGSDTLDPNPDNDTATLQLHIIGKTH
jgi:uncharacterized repeat protein (TIGR01451 family)